MALAVIAPVLSLLVLGGVLAWQITKMSESADLVTHTNQVIAKLYELRMRMGDKEAALRGYLLSNDAAHLTTFHAAMPKVALDEVEALTADNPVQQGRLHEAAASLLQWNDEAEHAVAVNAPVDQQSLKRRSALINRARQIIDTSIAAEQALLLQRSDDSDATDRAAKLWFIGLLGLSALTIAFISRRQLGVVSRAFSALVGAERAAKLVSRDQEWVRGGEATVAGGVVGEGSVAEVAQRGLDALCAHTGAALGAIYQLRGRELVRSAAVALPADAPLRVPADAGQLGAVVKSGESRRIHDAEAQIAVEGGAAKTQTVELVLVPAKIENRVIGVVELGFTMAPPVKLDEMMAGIGTTVAIAIRGAEHRARVQELLDETQRQGEELQTQHEELRVTNEELEQQGTALREAHARQQNIQHELEAANANLEEQTAMLEQQREELLRAQAGLEQHAKELQRASQYKSEFLARMSHELRTPLNSTLILARLLGDNPDKNLSEDQVRFANTIHSAGNDLLVLINDILDLAKIEAGRLELRVANVSLERVRDTLMREFEPVAKNRGLDLAIDLMPGLPAQLPTDEQRLVQVMRNLISNACKFTDKGGVRATIRPADGRIEISVSDTGIGIPADQLDAVFEAFHQVDGSVSRRHGGTGLGLAISRDLVQLLGGHLTVASTTGQGSTFTFDIPLAPPAQTARTATPVTPAPQRSSGMHRTAPPAPAPMPAGFDDRDQLSPDRRTLLVIEDDVKFALILRDLGREMTYQVLLSATADEGVELAMRHRPDGILLDVNLPDYSGLTVLERLKRQPAIRHIPIHMLSVEDHTRRSLELGAVGYLMKPASREELVGAIRRIEDRTSTRVRRVLIVEDDPNQQEALRALLGGSGVEIMVVPSKAEALGKLSSLTFDCVVMDLKLSDGTGFELLESMTSDERITFPPVIIYTGKQLSEAEEDELRLYSSSIIVKGARSPERLLDEVTLFLHQVEADMPQDRQKLLREVRDREALFEGKRVLIVEDDVRNVFALTSVLEPRGLKTVIARNGREALEAIGKEPIDLVLMDIMMPEMNGIDATKAIRENPAWKELPIIALTAKAMADDRQACLDAGASDYLAKPINVDMLLSLLRVWMPR
jgi:signal transduction histidine kinase/DNA-binding response OmpR family regulator/CHASE3 domain sensor protein